MKVLVIGSVYPRYPEDAEVPWLRTSIAQLKKKDLEIKVLAPAYKGLSDHVIDGVSVYRFRYAPKNLEILTHEEGAPSKMAKRPWLQLLAIPYIISGFFKCLFLCYKWRPHVIHAHWPFPHTFIALGGAKLFKIPLVLNFHGAELLLIKKKKWVKPLLYFAIGQAQAVFANSSFTAKKIKEIRNVHVECIPYGTTLENDTQRLLQNENTTQNNEDKASLSESKKKFTILFVGRHIERKGIEYLIESGKLLSPDDFEIRIVGEGDLTDKLKKQAATVETSIVFTGKLSSEDLSKEYENADVFVLPAIVDSKGDTEGLGVVLIEAIEKGLPVVASNVGGIPDVIENEKSGILVPEKNPKALAEAFKRLACDKEFVQKILKGAKEQIQEKFSWDKIIEKQISIYKSLQKK